LRQRGDYHTAIGNKIDKPGDEAEAKSDTSSAKIDVNAYRYYKLFLVIT